MVLALSHRRVSAEKKGFTLIELLVVVSIIALLVSILLPALNRAREQAQKVVCASNIKQTGTGLIMYAADCNGRFPVHDNLRTNIWLWDVTNPTVDIIEKYTGAGREFYYCPCAKMFRQNPELIDRYWDPSAYDGRNWEYRMTGYFWLLKRGKAADISTGYTQRLINKENLTGPKDYVDKLDVKNPAGRELVLDMVNSMEQAGSFDDFFEYLQSPGVDRKHPTNHYDTSSGKPQGSNILYVDQHVDWRDFSRMEVRIDYNQMRHWF